MKSKRQIPPKRWYPFMILHGITSQKINVGSYCYENIKVKINLNIYKNQLQHTLIKIYYLKLVGKTLHGPARFNV
jgi:hypothetical protein